jgi:hypothetical protein
MVLISIALDRRFTSYLIIHQAVLTVLLKVPYLQYGADMMHQLMSDLATRPP